MQPEPVPGHAVPGMHLWGWMSPEELTWLHETAAGMDGIVEIGCLHGRSSFALVTGTASTVWCIDPWNDDGYNSWMGSLGHLPNAKPMRMTSVEAAPLIPDVDMVFIDGDHHYESVVADLDAWLPKTRRLICGHDYTTQGWGGGVGRAVNERFENVKVAAGDIWMVEV